MLSRTPPWSPTLIVFEMLIESLGCLKVFLDQHVGDRRLVGDDPQVERLAVVEERVPDRDSLSAQRATHSGCWTAQAVVDDRAVDEDVVRRVAGRVLIFVFSSIPGPKSPP